MAKRDSSVLICVTDQIHCADWIERGCTLAEKLGARARILCVLPDPYQANEDALSELFLSCQALNASMTIVYSAKATPTILRIAKSAGVDHIVMGCPGDPSARGIVACVSAMMPSAQVYLPDEGKGLCPVANYERSIQSARHA